MKIVDRKKFVRMLIIVIGIVSFILFTFCNISFSKGDIKEKVVYVSEGDTLWNIASEEKENNLYYEQKDIRQIIYEIKQINSLDNNSILSVGQKLVVKTL